MSKQLEDKILSTADEIWEAASMIFPTKNLGTRPEILFELKPSKRAGFAEFYKQRVIMNLAYSFASWQETEETLAHELAHIICFRIYPLAKQYHGKEFRHVMQSLGYKGLTYHYMNVARTAEHIEELKYKALDDEDF